MEYVRTKYVPTYRYIPVYTSEYILTIYLALRVEDWGYKSDFFNANFYNTKVNAV